MSTKITDKAEDIRGMPVEELTEIGPYCKLMDRTPDGCAGRQE